MEVKVYRGVSPGEGRAEKRIVTHERFSFGYLTEAGQRVDAKGDDFVMPLVSRRREVDTSTVSDVDEFIRNIELSEVGHLLQGDRAGLYVADLQVKGNSLEYKIGVYDQAPKTT